MAIEDRNLTAGTRLEATYKKVRYLCTVEADEDGKLAFVLEDGKRYKSPSSAGSAVMGGSACNGWRFWTVEGQGGATMATQGATEADSAKTMRTKAGKAKKLIYRVPSQAKDGEGKSRWFCTACMKSFVQDGIEQPEVCPEGHRLDDLELTAPTVDEAPVE